MSEKKPYQPITRRDFLKMGGGAIGALAGANLIGKTLLRPNHVVEAAVPVTDMALSKQLGYREVGQQNSTEADFHFIASDGWMYMPADKVVPPYHPDDMAPPNLTTYMFGFRDVTMLGDNQELIYQQKEKVQTPAPLFWLKQEQDYTLKITNLGLQIRPDLIDAHTLHFHGFRNAIPIFDGEPHSSVGVPINRHLTYFYRPHDPGTYMYHCHFEETEHVHMGMVGPTFITPYQNEIAASLSLPVPWLGDQNVPDSHPRGYTYNDNDGSTAYHREFIAFLSEIWAESHWCDSHVQLPEWSDYKPEFYLFNGRVYPDTLEPHGEGTDLTTGDLLPPVNPLTQEPIQQLQYQPLSGLIEANAGERVLLRWINLGFEHQAMRLDGIKMRVVGKDATLLRGHNGADLSYLTNTIGIGPGESVDAIFVAPPYKGGTDGLLYDRYLLYNRNFNRLNNGGHGGHGGQMTEVRIYPPNTLGRQIAPNNRLW